ncbi:hypothetical protein ACFXNW_06000 [Nocardia sp. NPDC059180]|uniref:hypothetical protein n=1 Tax=Nocardia sp. NPDC059180 TaxID=3346761 RepID=UPI003696130B
MLVAYCRRWNFRRARAMDVLTADQARELDAAGQWYTVVLGEETAPGAILEVARGNRHITTNFLDEQGRQALAYDFRAVDDERMFMGVVTRWGFGTADARSISEADMVDVLAYRADGVVRRTVRDGREQQRRVTDFHDVRVDLNWEPVPAFGDWTSIARRDR